MHLMTRRALSISPWLMAASAALMVPTLWFADLSALSVVGLLGSAASISLMAGGARTL
jgi:hypothetical protein